MPANSRYRPDPCHQTLGPLFYDPVQAATFPDHILRYRNDRAGARVGLDTLTDAEWLNHFGHFEPLPDNLTQPLALRYHGHQFRSYNPDLGDGRGFLFAQLRDFESGRLLDLATKGSGQTPYSRFGDGRLTLKGGVREVLATEYLEALGVETSKSFSLIETGEKLVRNDEPSPTRSAVLVRLGHSHVRFGTFQRLAYHGERDAIARLVDYAIEMYWPEARGAPDPRAALFACACEACGQLAGEWYAAGFVHGVLNTDNTLITGESFDYGPWRWLPELDVGFTAAYFDQTGLYAFGRQPTALHWNLQRLAECLVGLTSREALVAELERFAKAFETRLAEVTIARLGLAVTDTARATERVVKPFYQALHDTKVPFEQAIFDWFGGGVRERLEASPSAEAYRGEPWSTVASALSELTPHHLAAKRLTDPYFSQTRPETMLYDEVEAIWQPIAARDDWSIFAQKIASLHRVGAAYADLVPPRQRPVITGGS